MRTTYFILTIIFLSAGTITKAQFNKRQKQFLASILSEKNATKSTLYYVANNDDRALHDVLKPDTLLDGWAFAGDDNPQNKLILTKTEKKYVSAQLHQLRAMRWEDHLLPNTTLLAKDTVQYYLNDRAYGWQRMYDRGIDGYYTFSNPIFLRKGTLCIFEYNFNCGSLCGTGKIMIYRKENGKWKPFISLRNSWS